MVESPTENSIGCLSGSGQEVSWKEEADEWLAEVGESKMKKTGFLFVAVLMSVVVWAQADLTPKWLQPGAPQNGIICCRLPDSPIPTLQQCRANFSAWDVPLRINTNAIAESTLPFNELEGRAATMSVCSIVALEHKLYTTPDGIYRSEMDKYTGLENLYEASKHIRIQDYMLRHGEYEQFIAEDAAGKR